MFETVLITLAFLMPLGVGVYWRAVSRDTHADDAEWRDLADGQAPSPRSTYIPMSDETSKRLLARKRRREAEEVRQAEGDASALFALVQSKRRGKSLRSRALTELTECPPADSEPFLLKIFESDDAYLRVKVVAFTLRKGFSEAQFPSLAARRSDIIHAELIRNGRVISAKRMLVRLLTRYDRSEFEPEVLRVLEGASGHLKREALGFIERFGSGRSIPVLERLLSRRTFRFRTKNTAVERVLFAVREREARRQGGVSLVDALDGGISRV